MTVAVPMYLPLPARLPDSKQDDFKNGSIFADMQDFILELGRFTRGVPEVTLTGAVIPRQGGIRYFVNLDGIPKADEQAIRDGLQQGRRHPSA